jgi:hypothetical protein
MDEDIVIKQMSSGFRGSTYSGMLGKGLLIKKQGQKHSSYMPLF